MLPVHDRHRIVYCRHPGLETRYEDEAANGNRISLLRVLNNERASTRNIPPETMSLIFRHMHDDHETPTVHLPKLTLTLGQVSFRWRQIAWSTPQLWTRMFALIKAHSIKSTVELLQLYLHNVRGLPFLLKVVFVESLGEGPLDPLLKLLSDGDRSGKIRSLTLVDRPHRLLGCLSNGTLLNLESLDLWCTRVEPRPTFSLINMPYLCKLRLCDAAPTVIELSWPIITSLYLDLLPIDICMNLFVQCPNLIEAHVCNPSPDASNGLGPQWADSSDTITLPHLKILSWTYDHYPNWLSVFRRIRAPSLQELNWCGGLQEYTNQEPLLLLLADCPSISTLTKLNFAYVDDCDALPLFRRIFAQTKYLQVLGFDRCDHTILKHALSVLDPATGPENQTIYLPLLNELSIEEERVVSINEDLQWMIFKLMERQWHFGVRLFSIEKFINIFWGTEVKLAIRSLVEEGFEIEISETLYWVAEDSESESGD